MPTKFRGTNPQHCSEVMSHDPQTLPFPSTTFKFSQLLPKQCWEHHPQLTQFLSMQVLGSPAELFQVIEVQKNWLDAIHSHSLGLKIELIAPVVDSSPSAGSKWQRVENEIKTTAGQQCVITSRKTQKISLGISKTTMVLLKGLPCDTEGSTV